MKFSSGFILLTYAVALWAFVGLVVSGDLHAPAIVLFLAAVGFAAFRTVRGIRVPALPMSLLSLVAFAVALHGWFVVGERMYSVTYFLLYLEAHKLVTARTTRDYLQVYGLTFFHILAASVSTTSVAFAPVLVVYVLLIVGAMMVLTLRRDAERTFATVWRGRDAPGHGTPYRLAEGDRRALAQVRDARIMDRGFAGWLVAVTVGVTALGGVVFWLVPRSSHQNFIQGLSSSSPPMRSSGFADNVTFGGVGEIQTDPTIVIRVEPEPRFVQDRPTLLRIRGTVLDAFNGYEWRRSAASRFDDAPVTRVDFRRPQSTASDDEIFRARFTLESDANGYLFTIDQPTEVDFGDRRRLLVDQAGGVVKMANPRNDTISYDAIGRIQTPVGRRGFRERLANRASAPASPFDLLRISAQRGRQLPSVASGFAAQVVLGDDVDDDRQRYVMLPETPDIDVIHRLAIEWTEGISTDLEKALEIERRLRTEFRYSLDNRYSNRDDHLSYFLQVARSGHCEYFATAMVLMLRALDIPSRIVNGYVTDEWSRAGGGRYIVRQEHAHSWVEAQFPGEERWITFDPTPSEGVGSNRIGTSLYHRLSAFYDTLKMLWYNNVVDYSSQDQRESLIRLFTLMRFAARGMAALQSEAAGLLGGAGGGSFSVRRLAGALLLFAAAAGAVLLWSTRARQGARRPVTDDDQDRQRLVEVVRPYVELLGEMQAVLPRNQSQTPREYAARVAAHDGLGIREFATLTDRYYDVRYNRGDWTGEMDRLVGEVREKLAPHRGGSRPS